MKKILLQTMPHSGTHTMHYLFNVLGGIEVVWHHWEPNAELDIEYVKNMDWEDFVFVRTYRSPASLFESYASRDPEGGSKYFYKCVEMFAKHNLAFPVPIGIEIEGPNIHKTKWVLEVFRRCEVVPPEVVLDYMETWKKTNERSEDGSPQERHGFSENDWPLVKKSLHKGRVQTWRTN